MTKLKYLLLALIVAGTGCTERPVQMPATCIDKQIGYDKYGYASYYVTYRADNGTIIQHSGMKVYYNSEIGKHYSVRQ